MRHLIILVLCLFANTAFGRDVTLRWDPNPEPDIAGYRIIFGKVSGAYTTTIDVGNVTLHTVDGLDDDAAYFFAITAYNEAGLESVPSNEASSYPLLETIESPVITTLIHGDDVDVEPSHNNPEGVGKEIHISWTYGDDSLISYFQVYGIVKDLNGIEGKRTFDRTPDGESRTITIIIEPHISPHSIILVAINDLLFRSIESNAIRLNNDTQIPPSKVIGFRLSIQDGDTP